MKKFGCILICFCILFLTVSCSFGLYNELKIKDIEEMLSNPSVFKLATDINFSNTAYKRYQQIYQGVPIFNSSVIKITDNADNSQLIGEYYDFSSFDKVNYQNIDITPTWLRSYEDNGISVIPDMNSVSVVIYVTDNKDAVPALYFTVSVSNEKKNNNYQLVVSLDGEKVYFCEPFSNSFETGVVSNDNEMLDVFFNEGLYYASCKNHYYYVWDQKLTEKKDVEKDITEKGFLFDEDVILKTSQKDWSEGYFNLVFDSMNVMNEVEDFWSSEYAYYGIDGNKNYAKLIVLDSYIDGTAICGGKYSIVLGMTPDGKYSAADAPEIVAHEFTHGVLKNYCGLINTNESGALHEAISDVFGVVFSNKTNWKLAEKFSCYNISKDIASQKKTMKEFEYDSYLIDLRFYNLGKLFKIGEKSEQYVHANSYILSHVLYEICSNVFDNDLKFFGQIMFNSLKYLPSNAGFSEFRNAFSASVNELCDKKTTEKCSRYFETAGIENSDEFFIITKIDKIEGVPNTENDYTESSASESGTDNENHTVNDNNQNIDCFNLYKQYFYQHYDENDTVCLVDLTHDCTDDMLVFAYSGDNVGPEIHLFTATDGEVKEIYSRGIHNFRTKIFLTASKGICNMIISENAIFQGVGSLNTSEIYFSESGEITEISNIIQEIASGDDVDEKQDKYDIKIKNLYGKDYSNVYLFPTGYHDEHKLMVETNPLIVFNGKPEWADEETTTEKREIFGTWYCDIDAYGDIMTLIVSFSEDGSAKYSYGYKSSELIESFSGSWEKQHDIIVLDLTERTIYGVNSETTVSCEFYGTYRWTIKNNNLILEYVEGKLLFDNEKDTIFVFSPEQI